MTFLLQRLQKSKKNLFNSNRIPIIINPCILMKYHQLYCFLTLLLLLSVGKVLAQETTSNYFFFQEDPIEEKAYRSVGLIYAEQSVVRSPSRVVFRSEDRIVLDSEFKVELGASFRAEIGETMLVYEENGELVYETDNLWPDGNRISDFSYAGYKNGEMIIPTVPVQISISPSTNPDTNLTRINNAIASMEAISLGSDGFRGTIFLESGIWEIAEGFTQDVSGVVLRGAGNDPSSTNTTLKITSTSPIDAVTIGGKTALSWESSDLHTSSTRYDITTDIPITSRSFNINNASANFSDGDPIVIVNPCSSAWFDVLEDEYPNIEEVYWNCNDNDFDILYKRTVDNVNGNTITVREPFFMPIVNYGQNPWIAKYDPTNTLIVTNVGIEDIIIDIDYDPTINHPGGCGFEYTDLAHAKNGIVLKGVEDAWVRNVTIKHFATAGVLTRVASRITIENSLALDPVSPATGLLQGEKRYNFWYWWLDSICTYARQLRQ